MSAENDCMKLCLYILEILNLYDSNHPLIQ